ncbi:NHS-like protein 3 isoform 2-T2 [Pholidichthys leucotaenia]
MSRRKSTGDLVPRDISEILAREARAQRAQKKHGSSLEGAFSWLKGSRKKKNISNGLNRIGTGGADAKLGFQNQDSVRAGPKANEDQKRLKVHYTASQHYPENVFIEGSRPQYLEDLHTEAQEGLKILQQEEYKNGVNFPDDESVASTDTLCAEQDVSSMDGVGSLESRSTTGNTDATATSAVAARSVLTHQGSTFKPLNPGKRSDKSKKRTRRTTIMGIPNQVQKELARHRSSTFQPLVSAQVSNHNRHASEGQPGVLVIPTVDEGTSGANKEGARVHLSQLETFRDNQLHVQTVYGNEQSLSHQGFGSHLCHSPILRPKSLAVPGMTTSLSFTPSTLNFLQEPQGPVMSISPQATYMSTVIPNAVLPASVEVIEIDRSHSRTRGSSVNLGSSIHTVSKSSLTSRDSSVSPLPSRRSERDGSQTSNSHDNPTLMPPSASGSILSESKSSDTIMSRSSLLSSKDRKSSSSSQKVGLHVQESQTESTGGDQELASLQNSATLINSPRSKCKNFDKRKGFEFGVSGSVGVVEQGKNKGNCARSLSVMKTKQPPAPPRRTNSLHNNKIKGNSSTLVNCKDLNDPEEVTTAAENVVAKNKTVLVTVDSHKILTPESNSTGSTSINGSSNHLGPMQAPSKECRGATEPPPESSTSSPKKITPEDGKFERTMSPSSGYSSQSGTPTLSPKGMSPTSPDKHKKPVKPERSASRASSTAASPSSSVTSLSSGTSEGANPDVSKCSPGQLPPCTLTKEQAQSNNSSAFREEVQELLNIPPPPKVKAPHPPPPETWVHNRRTFELLCRPYPDVNKVPQKPAEMQESTNDQTGARTQISDNLQALVKTAKTVCGTAVLESAENSRKSEVLSAVQHEGESAEYESSDQVRTLIQDKENVIQRQEESSSALIDQGSQEETPKKDQTMTTLQSHKILLTEQHLENQKKESGSSATVEVYLSVDTFSQDGPTVFADDHKPDKDTNEVCPRQMLTVDVPKINKMSPPPTPPPPYHPTPPPSRKSPPSSVSTSPNELQQSQVVESCWPPPPPPLEGDSVFEGGDEVDFPPPPPPFLPDCVPDVMNTCVTGQELPNESTVQGPDLLPAKRQPVLTNSTPVVVMQLSEADSGDDSSHQLVQSVSFDSDSVSASPVESSTPRAESPQSVMPVAPPSSFQKRNSLKIEEEPPSAPPISAHMTAPVTPALPADDLAHGVNFRRKPSIANRDARSKELLSRHKSAPISKEDANIPLVTPSLLQMVRLRSVNMTEDQVKAPSMESTTNEEATPQHNCPVSTQGPQNIPQKPIRKSLSLKSYPHTMKAPSVTMSTPSMRLQEAIRMKTAAMSSRDALPSRLSAGSPTYGCGSEPGTISLKSPESYDMHKSPASTASFIFSRSTKKVIIETAASLSPEAQASLKQSLAAELLQVSDQSKAATFSNGGLRCDKVPPPVAKKPTQSSISPSSLPNSLGKSSVRGNGATGGVPHMSGVTPPETTTTRVTADTIETLF